MIGRIQGQLDAIEGATAMVTLGQPEQGSLTYEVMLPAYIALRLQTEIGQRISLLTFHFVESIGQGTTLIPRLAGFLTPQDRDFFELFTTCKGVGNKRALRAMTMEPQQIAQAIADRDVATLQTLPEIGKRMAETVVATLHGKVDAFITPQGSAVGKTGKSAKGQSAAAPATAGSIARQALEVLVQLGEQRNTASQWIDQIMRDTDNRPADVQDLVARVYRLKSGG